MTEPAPTGVAHCAPELWTGGGRHKTARQTRQGRRALQGLGAEELVVDAMISPIYTLRLGAPPIESNARGRRTPVSCGREVVERKTHNAILKRYDLT